MCEYIFENHTVTLFLGTVNKTNIEKKNRSKLEE